MEKKKEQEKSSQNLTVKGKVIRVYYMAGSALLDKALLALGYGLSLKTEGHGRLLKYIYCKGNITVKQGYMGLEIFKPANKIGGPPVSLYKGLSINKDMLDFITNREPFNIKQ